MSELSRILGLPLFQIGDKQTTLGSLLVALGVVIATLVLAKLARKSAQAYFQRECEPDAEVSRSYGIIPQLVIWFIGFEVTLHLLGIHLTTLFAAGGLFALGAGFATKSIIENFLAGCLLRVEKTTQRGDLIVVKGTWLIVQRIGFRSIIATTYDGTEVMIPNSLVTQSPVENLTRGDRLHRIRVPVGVSYDSDLRLVRKTLEQLIDRLAWRSQERESGLFLREFGDSSVNYDLDVWIDEAGESLGRISDLHEAVWWALKENGITIAYPQLDVHLDSGAAEITAKRD